MQQTPSKFDNKTQIFSHRGANREAAENTREAFDRALMYQIDGIETDIQLSRDEILVLWHDRYTDKLGRPGRHIDDFSLAELETLVFAQGTLASSRIDCGDGKIMTLDAFLLAYRHRCRLLLEIKNRDWETSDRHQLKVEKLLQMVLPLGSQSITVSSFNLASLLHARQCSDRISLIYNIEDDQTLDEAREVLNQHPFLQGLCLPIGSLDKSWMDMLRSASKDVAVYTCNTEVEISKALDLQVDVIVSDLPQLAIRLRDG